LRHEFDDPALLKPHERLRELAAVRTQEIHHFRTGGPRAPESDPLAPQGASVALCTTKSGSGQGAD